MLETHYEIYCYANRVLIREKRESWQYIIF